MSGGMYIPVGIGSPNFRRAYRLFKSNAGSGVRYTLGRIKMGNDYLFPGLDYKKDICTYIMGSNFTNPASCPKFSMDSRGRPNAAQYMSYSAVPTDWTLVSADIPTLPSTVNERIFISHTYRYTNKIKGRDYSTYDSSLHRRAGVTGGLEPINLNNQTYNSLPHGNVFFFDIENNWLPTCVLLVAVSNLSIVGYAYRHTIQSYTSTIRWGRIRDGQYDFNHYDAGDLRTYTCNNTTQEPGYTYYIRPSTGSVANLYRWYVTEVPRIVVTIDGTQYTLVIVMIDSIYGASTTLYWKTFESPMLQVKRNDTSRAASCYILDEAVTIHKPGNDPE